MCYVVKFHWFFNCPIWPVWLQAPGNQTGQIEQFFYQYWPVPREWTVSGEIFQPVENSSGALILIYFFLFCRIKMWSWFESSGLKLSVLKEL